MYALNLAEDGRILSATYPQFAPADAVIVDALPDGDAYDYRFVDGKYIYDPIPETPEIPTEPVNLESRVEILETESTEMKLAIDALLGVTE